MSDFPRIEREVYLLSPLAPNIWELTQEWVDLDGTRSTIPSSYYSSEQDAIDAKDRLERAAKNEK